MEDVRVKAEWTLAVSDDPDAEERYVVPDGMVETALNELGAVIVAVELELPEPA